MSNVQNSIPADEDRKAMAHFVSAASCFRRSRNTGFTMMVGVGGQRALLRVREGAVAEVHDLATLRPLTSWDFSVIAEAETWRRFWRPVPEAGWHDLFALTRNGRMQLEGNLHPLMANLQFVKDVLASPRHQEQP